MKSEKTNKQKNTSSSLDNLYDSARIATRLGYTLLPTGAYIASSEKTSEIDQLNWFYKMIAKVFYNGEIQKLAEFNDYSAKSVGVGAALLGGYALDKFTEEIFPRSKETRKALQPIGYFTLANLVNLASNGAKSLESLVSDTMTKTGEVISNLSDTGNSSDGEYFVNTLVASLVSLAAVKGANSLIFRSGLAASLGYLGKQLIKNVFWPFKVGYDLTLGEANERYESRRISGLLEKNSHKRSARELENIHSRSY